MLCFGLEESFTEPFSFLVAEERDEEEADESFFRFAEGWGEGEEVEVILASSANKAGARVLTTASRSDGWDSDWTASGKRKEKCI